MDEITGEIISTQLGVATKAGKQYGFIVVRTPKEEDLRFKVDVHTDYESLDRGKKVKVHYEPFQASNMLVARKVLPES